MLKLWSILEFKTFLLMMNLTERWEIISKSKIPKTFFRNCFNKIYCQSSTPSFGNKLVWDWFLKSCHFWYWFWFCCIFSRTKFHILEWSMSCSVFNNHNFFYQEHNALTFNWDKFSHSVYSWLFSIGQNFVQNHFMLLYFVKYCRKEQHVLDTNARKQLS